MPRKTFFQDPPPDQRNPVYQYTGLPVYHSTSIPAYLYTGISVYPGHALRKRWHVFPELGSGDLDPDPELAIKNWIQIGISDLDPGLDTAPNMCMCN